MRLPVGEGQDTSEAEFGANDMYCGHVINTSSPLSPPHHRVEESKSHTWVFVLPRALESCCRRTEWCCPPLVSGNQRQLGSFPIGKGFLQSSGAH